MYRATETFTVALNLAVETFTPDRTIDDGVGEQLLAWGMPVERVDDTPAQPAPEAAAAPAPRKPRAKKAEA